MKSLLIGSACALVVAMAAPAAAHHSAAGMDRTKSVTIVGTVKQFSWSNPHSWLEIDVPNDKGGADKWTVEMTAPSYLVRAGWKSSTVKAGDKVSVILRPMRNGDPGGLLVSIALPDGRTLTERAIQPPAAPAP